MNDALITCRRSLKKSHKAVLVLGIIVAVILVLYACYRVRVDRVRAHAEKQWIAHERAEIAARKQLLSEQEVANANAIARAAGTEPADTAGADSTAAGSAPSIASMIEPPLSDAASIAAQDENEHVHRNENANENENENENEKDSGEIVDGVVYKYRPSRRFSRRNSKNSRTKLTRAWKETASRELQNHDFSIQVGLPPQDALQFTVDDSERAPSNSNSNSNSNSGSTVPIVPLSATGPATANLAATTATANVTANVNASATAKVASASAPYVPPPKILWTHWHTADPPPMMQKNLQRTRRILEPAGWTVNFITTATFLEMCPYPFSKFFDLDPTHQCDYLRLWILAEFGGLYMDVSIVLNDTLQDFYDAMVAQRAEFGGFYKRQRSFPPPSKAASAEGPLPDKPVHMLENFFIMAPKASPLIVAWRDEYAKAAQLGFGSYRRCIKELGVSMKSHSETYFAAYQALQRILQMKDRAPPVLYLEATEEAMYMIEVMCNENPVCIYKAYRDRDLMASIPYLKLPRYRRPMFPIEFFDELPQAESEAETVALAGGGAGAGASASSDVPVESASAPDSDTVALEDADDDA